MIPNPDQLRECLQFLTALHADRAPPTEALARLADLRAAIAAARIDLVWDVEASGAGITYALLLSIDGVTYSLGAVRQGSTPWPLRGATDPRAELLVTVDGVSITIGKAIGVLDFIWRTRSLADRLIDVALLAAEHAHHEAEVDGAEIAAALLRLRAERGLRDEPAYQRWLTARRITEEQLRAWIAGVLVSRRLEERLVDGKLERELEVRPDDYARARVAWFEIHEELAASARALIAEGCEVLEIAAALGSCAVELGDVFRHEAPAAFDVVAGTTLLLAVGGSLRVARVLEREAAPPAEAIRNRATKRLVAERLRHRRAHAEIEWHWGRAEASGTTYAKR